MSFLKTIPSRADCITDCKKIIQAADAAIQARDKQINDQTMAISDLQRSLSDTTRDLDLADARLNSWYRNPFIVGAIGVLVGGLTVTYLKR